MNLLNEFILHTTSFIRTKLDRENFNNNNKSVTTPSASDAIYSYMLLVYFCLFLVMKCRNVIDSDV